MSATIVGILLAAGQSTRFGSNKLLHQLDNFEGRTQISPEVADAFGLETLIAGPAVLQETVTVYGRIMTNTERVREVSARFDGVIQSVHPSLGDSVREGQALP